MISNIASVFINFVYLLSQGINHCGNGSNILFHYVNYVGVNFPSLVLLDKQDPMQILSVAQKHIPRVIFQNRVNRYPSTTATRKYKTKALENASMCFLGFW